MFARVFTTKERESVRDHVLQAARNDPRVVAGAIVGSLADGGGDRFSDLDLTFAVRDDATVEEVLAGWTATFAGELDAVHLVDLESGSTTYRVYLLPGALQLDVSMTPAVGFHAGGPRFQLLFGDARPVPASDSQPVGHPPMFIPTPLAANDVFGWGVVYALHANACIERGRVWQAERYVVGVRDHALTLACLNRGLRASNARGYDDLPADVLAGFADSHVGALDKRPLRQSLAASVGALLREGRAGQLPHAENVAQHLRDLSRLRADSS